MLVAVLGVASIEHEEGRFSHYAPGDGHNAGELACGGKFTREQVHIAYRGWHKRGCGSHVIVYSEDTQVAVLTTIQDAGPFGAYRGPIRRAKAEGRWKVITGALPAGWKWRGLLDASYGLWVKLRRPRFLSRVHLVHVPGWLAPAAALAVEAFTSSLDFVST